MYAYELFKLTSADMARLKCSDAPKDIRVLGQWYIFTAPTEDYVMQAETCFRKAMELGDAEAKLHLANMYRLGDLGKVDLDNYRRLLGEAADGGCQLAEIRLCKDIAYGVGQRADIDKGLEEAQKRLAGKQNPDPRWFDTIGWMLLSKGEPKQANDWFLKAIGNGYVDSYYGLTDMPEMMEKGRDAGCGGSCILIAEELKKKYDESGRNDSNAVECFSDDDQKRAYLDANYKYREELAAQIEALYEEAEKLGEPSGCYYRGMLYYNAEYHHFEDDDKAWACFMRGARMGDLLSMGKLADMTEEGRAPEQFGWEDACLFRLKALRYGDEEQLLPVIQAYFEGDLEEYKDEIESLYKPLYNELAFEQEGLENWPDDDPEDDDGRFDAWA